MLMRFTMDKRTPPTLIISLYMIYPSYVAICDSYGISHPI